MIEEQIKISKSELGNLSLKDLFYKYIRFFPLFILSVALALLAAYTYLRYASQVYRAAGSMHIKSETNNNQSDKVEDILMGNNRSQNIQSEIEILKSRPLMARVVNKLNLQFGYTAKGRIKDQNVYKQAPFIIDALNIFDSARAFSMKIKFNNGTHFRINNETKDFGFDQVFENKNGAFRLIRNGVTPIAGSEFTLTWRPVDDIAGRLARTVKVQPKAGGTGILVIDMEAANPQLAADIVNNLMIQYDSMTIEQNNFSTDQIIGFIDDRLDTLRKELNSIQANLLAYRQKNNLIDVETQSDVYFQKISAADNLVNQQQMKVGVADIVDEYLRDKRNEYNKIVVPSSLGLEDETLNELVMGYNKSQLERQSLLESSIPPNHPAVRELEALIEKQRESVLENLKNMKLSYLQGIANVQGQAGKEESEAQSLPFKMKEVIEMERQVTTKLALYGLLEAKREEAAISRASTISNSKIIDKATASPVPVKPDKRMIQILAIFIGLGLPTLIIFVAELLNDKVTTRFDIEKLTTTPIMGEIGHSHSQNVLIVNKVSRKMVAEQFRIIRTNMQYVLNKIERPVILVTSSFSGEGKSFISTNMGAVIALTGKKTIILEFDIRKPKILAGLNMGKRPGISNYLVGKAELKDLILPVPGEDNLFVLPCGPVPPNPAELLLDQRVAQLFETMRRDYDAVIIDTAPVGMVSDAMTLGKFADCTIYLVRQGHTYKKQIGLIDDLYNSKKLPAVSIVVNDVKLKAGYGYYGYGRYGYGYGYGHSGYYEEEAPRKSLLDKIAGLFGFRRLFRSRR
ncbi:MAG TPA: polysaccharide biosynthesis tyrosine autokinase [Chitinophagaceae bacterium]|nr:polysaccharide biosynthesis tyrosine autokinase [Chitinophagaceae bacterium]